MASLQELQEGLIAADKAGNVEDAKTFADAIRSHPDQPGNTAAPDPATMTTGQKYAETFMGGMHKLGQQIMPKLSPQSVGSVSLTDDAPSQALSQSVAQYDQRKPQLDLGWKGEVVEKAPEVIASMNPIARTGSLLAKTPALARSLGKYAPAVTDIGVNAAYGGAKSAAEGNDALDVLKDTGWAAAGAAGGRAIAKTLGAAGGYLTRPMSAAAQLLKDNGISVTPAQAYPGGIVAGIENLAKLIPGYGAKVEKAQARTGDDYFSHMLADAVAPIGAKVEGTGLKAVNDAHAAIDKVYDDVVPRTYLRPGDAISAANYALQDIDKMSLLTPTQQGQMRRYISETLVPEIQKAAAGGPNALISGRTAKNLDSMLGEQARSYADSAETRQLANAFYAVQKRLRVALSANNPVDKGNLFKANEAFKNLLPLREAVEQSLSQGGMPTTVGIRQNIRNAGGKPDALSDAAVTVQPTRNWAEVRRLTGAAAMGASLAGGPMSIAGTAAGLAGAGGLGSILGSRTAVKGYLAAMGLPRQTAEAFGKLPYADQVKALNLLTQAGREVGQQQGENNAP